MPFAVCRSIKSQNNLQQIIDKVKARNPDVRVVIAGMQLPNYVGADDYVSAFGKMFTELAAKNGPARAVSSGGRGRRSITELARRHSSKRRWAKSFGRERLARSRAGCTRDSRRAGLAR